MSSRGSPSPLAFEVVAITASLGGHAALQRVLETLPASFPASVLVAYHRSAGVPSHFVELVQRRVALPVGEAQDGARVSPGCILLAPPGCLMEVRPPAGAHGPLRLSVQPDVSASRCGGDTLLASVAAADGTRSIGVVLSGRLSDGAEGVRRIKSMGGRVLVQDELSAEAPEMPRAAAATGCVDFVLPPERVGAAIVALVMVPGAAELFRVPPPPWARLSLL